METQSAKSQQTIQNGDVDMQEYEKLVEETQNKTGRVTKKDFQMLSVIGKGSYGKVLLVKKVDT